MMLHEGLFIPAPGNNGYEEPKMLKNAEKKDVINTFMKTKI
jgi:hypothetical protein